jgi:hypothetical protein
MKTRLREPPPEDLRRWAGGQLKVGPEASAAQVRAAALAALPDEEFVPPESWQHALRLLSRPREQRPASAAALRDYTDELRSEVEEFAADFFDLDPPERRRQWQALCDRAGGFAPVAARLGLLERGLDIDRASLPTEPPRVAELANEVCDLFVLRPAARAARRRAFLQGIRTSEGTLNDWQEAARRLRADYPAVADLELHLVGELVSGAVRRRGRSRKGSRLRTRLSAPASASSDRGSKMPLWLILVFVGGAIARSLGSLADKTQSPPAPQPPPIQVPQFRQNDPPVPQWQDNGRWGKPWKDGQRPPELRKRIKENRRRAKRLAEEFLRRQKLHPGQVGQPPAPDDDEEDSDNRSPPGKTPP